MKPFRPVTTVALSCVAALVAAACTTVNPEDFQPLRQARSEYQAAAADPKVTQNAQLELQRAERELRLAEQAVKETRDTDVWEHQAYLALRSAQLARETATLRSTEQEITKADAERKQLLLAAREREASTARAQADQARARESTAAQEAQAKVQEAERRAAELQARVQSLQADLQNAKTEKTDRGTVMTFAGDLLFDTGQATLKPGGQRAMMKIAEVLKTDPGTMIVVEGFTDSVGSEDMNQALSERRALAVKQALVSQGAESSRIEARGYGEAYPVASNDTPAGRQLNRRVEVVFGGEGKSIQERTARTK